MPGTSSIFTVTFVSSFETDVLSGGLFVSVPVTRFSQRVRPFGSLAFSTSFASFSE